MNTPQMLELQNQPLTGSDWIVNALLKVGVEVVFGYPGGAIMPLYDALYRHSDRLRHVLVRHEQGAAHAAVGYARATGKPGICIATSGPGAANLITGIADAMLDSVPLICITGQVTSHLIGSDAFQEVDILSLSAAVTKWSVQVCNSADIPAVFARAFEIACNGRPGPVLIDIAKDAQMSCTLARDVPKNTTQNCANELSSSQFIAAANFINQAERPLVLFGQGILIAQAQAELAALLDHTNIPAAATLLGLSAIPTSHPCYKGMLGMHGNYAPNVLTNEADVILAVGMRFDDRVTGDLSRYARQAKIIHIDIDRAELNKNVQATVALCCDAKIALQTLLPLMQKKQHPEWHARFAVHHHTEYQTIIQAELQPTAPELTMAEVIACLSELTQGQALLVTDVGQHQMVAARYYQFAANHSHITSGGLGTMGFALPAAIGAQLGQPTRMVIAIIGDGGFQMTVQELAVLAQENLKVKIIVLNNQYLGMVRQWQELFFAKRYACVELHNPNFPMLANAYGIDATCVTAREQLRESLVTLLNSTGPYLLEVKVAKQEKVFPMIEAGCAVHEIRLF